MVKRQSMPDSTCSVCINVYVILRLFFSYYWRLAKLHTIPCAMMCERTLASLCRSRFSLHNTLCHDGFGDFHEAGDVGSLYVVDVAVRLCSVLYAVLVDVFHDHVETVVNFF